MSLACDLTVRGGNVYQVRFPLPESFAVESVALEQPGMVERPIRWSRGPSGPLIAFLPGPPGEQYKLKIRGLLPHALDKTVEAPALHAEGAAIEKQTVIVFREPEVQARVADQGGLMALRASEAAQALDQAIGDGLLDRATLARRGLS